VLGINDPWIWGVYLLCILSSLLCIAYGFLNWNRDMEFEESKSLEEAIWGAQEEKMEQQELGL
jgi:hypothetical protein